MVERLEAIWHDDEDEFPHDPMDRERDALQGGHRNLWSASFQGSLEGVLEVVNHVEGTIPVLNMAHIHARGHGSMRTSEHGELFDRVRETIGTKDSLPLFWRGPPRWERTIHTQIEKSDLNFEPLAEFIVEDGGWLDITLISDSPLLEHDAMYMLQSIEKSRHKQIERKAREDRRALALQTGASVEDLKAEKQNKPLRTGQKTPEPAEEPAPEPAPEPEAEAAPEPEAKPKKGGSKAKKATRPRLPRRKTRKKTMFSTSTKTTTTSSESSEEARTALGGLLLGSS